MLKSRATPLLLCLSASQLIPLVVLVAQPCLVLLRFGQEEPQSLFEVEPERPQSLLKPEGPLSLLKAEQEEAQALMVEQEEAEALKT
jgi:hypothetical protein